jgi:KaiC/GvpD/RAD55 family RecA-like ATPase
LRHTTDTDRIDTTEETYGGELRLENRLLDVKQLLTMPDEPVPWRCDRLAADGHVTLITGEGGEGKSLFTLALAKGVAEGSSVAGIDCEPGNAVMFDAENGEKLIARRAKAAGVPPNGIAFYEADGFDLQRHVEQFERAIRRHDANLVVIDSLRILAHTARESEADHMAPLMSKIRRLARSTNAAIIVIHHRGKGENASDYRGSSVIRDQADMLFVLGRGHNDPNAATRRFLRTSKLRIDSEPETRWFNLSFDSAGKLTIEEAEPFAGTARSGRQTNMEALAEQLQQLLCTCPCTRADLARAVGRNPGDGQVLRALQLLDARGLAEQVESGWQLVIQPSNPQGAGWMDDAGEPAAVSLAEVA